MGSPHIEMAKGRVRYYLRVKGSNGQRIFTSQKYYSHSNAKRTGTRFAEAFGVEFKDLD